MDVGDHQSTHRGDMSACSSHGRDAEGDIRCSAPCNRPGSSSPLTLWADCWVRKRHWPERWKRSIEESKWGAANQLAAVSSFSDVLHVRRGVSTRCSVGLRTSVPITPVRPASPARRARPARRSRHTPIRMHLLRWTLCTHSTSTTSKRHYPAIALSTIRRRSHSINPHHHLPPADLVHLHAQPTTLRLHSTRFQRACKPLHPPPPYRLTVN